MVVHAEVHLNSTGNLIHPFHTSRAFKLKMHGSMAHANGTHLDRRLRKSRAPFSAREEVFNEGLPWKQVCKDVNALPSLAPDNSFRQRRNFFPPSSADCWRWNKRISILTLFLTPAWSHFDKAEQMTKTDT